MRPHLLVVSVLVLLAGACGSDDGATETTTPEGESTATATFAIVDTNQA